MADWKMRSRLRWARLGRPLQALRKGDSRESERGRALGGDCEGALEGDANTTQCAFFKEAADQGDAVGQASGVCTLSRSMPWLRVNSSKAAAPSAKRIKLSELYGQLGRKTSTGTMPSFGSASRAARSTSVAGASFIQAGK